MKNTEKKLLEIVAADRLYKPVSSMSGKLGRIRSKLAKEVASDVGENFKGDRLYAWTETSDTMKARGIRNAIDEFANKYP